MKDGVDIRDVLTFIAMLTIIIGGLMLASHLFTQTVAGITGWTILTDPLPPLF